MAVVRHRGRIVVCVCSSEENENHIDSNAVVIFYTYVVYAPPPIIRERPFLGSNITSVKASANYAQSLLFVHSLVPCHYLIMML